MAKKWWKGLLRTTGLGGGLAELPMLPLGTYMVCFENSGVGTLLSGLYSYFTPLEASLAAHGKMELCVAHCQQSHSYLGPEQTKPLRERDSPSGMARVCFSHLLARTLVSGRLSWSSLVK